MTVDEPGEPRRLQHRHFVVGQERGVAPIDLHHAGVCIDGTANGHAGHQKDGREDLEPDPKVRK